MLSCTCMIYSVLLHVLRGLICTITLVFIILFFFFQAEDGIRDAQESRGLGDVYKRQFGASALTESERQIAEDIFRVMLRDAAVRVRQALSESLKDNPDVPHDVAASLAQDVDEVAMPVIEFSSVLTDKDLIDIVRTRGTDVQKVVAGRRDVSEDAVSYTHLTLPTKRIV
eukprot:TRINITY_DN33877_c0_g1_i1.p1 TRINITY_DN33877_c0_g1~~TRINITY_DN33877_c0_g1_i1.p1  ORF type:complete len:170 (-),score=13.33 TRINITY_DN33877_c0_g1_i1:98-607(-)